LLNQNDHDVYGAPNRRLIGAPKILIERFSSKKVLNKLLHGVICPSLGSGAG